MDGYPTGGPPVESAQQLLDLKRAIDHAAIVRQRSRMNSFEW